MNELVTRPGALTETSASASIPTLLTFIATAARDPSVDIAKFETLLRMQREILADDAKLAFNRALSQVQAETAPVLRDAENKQTNSRYAKLEAIDGMVRPIYARHGFSLSFNSEPLPDNNIRISCDVAHDAGHTRTYNLEAGLDVAGAQGKVNKTSLHGLGSTVSYLRRYLTAMIFNIVFSNEDDDGNRGGNATRPPPGGWDRTTTQTRTLSTPWADQFVPRLLGEANAWKWMNILIAGLAEAPAMGDLEEIAILPAVIKARETAPPEASTKIEAAFSAAYQRLTPPPPTKPKASTPAAASVESSPATKPATKVAPKVEPPAEPQSGFEAVLIDEAGDITSEPFTDPVAFARAYVTLWNGLDIPGQEAAREFNEEALTEAFQNASAKAILTDTEVKQKVQPAIAVVEPPVERGKTSWAGYVKLLKAKLMEVGVGEFGAWVAAQRDTLEKCHMAQRALAVRAITETASMLRVDQPLWLADLIRAKDKPANPSTGEAEPVTDADERWVNNQIAEVRRITTREGFDQLVGSTAVRTVMARLRRDKPALFVRADAVFTDKHLALPGDEGR